MNKLIQAARYGNLEEVKTLIKAGVDINVKSGYGTTALMLAASFGHTEVVKLLKQAGAE